MKQSRQCFCSGADRHPHRQIALLLNNLSALQTCFEEGSVVILEETRIRIRASDWRRGSIGGKTGRFLDISRWEGFEELENDRRIHL
jgi:hypothetical protein